MKDGMKRLKTKQGIELGKAILSINSNDWWFPKNSVIRKKKYIK
jgi:hypothetical protein